MWLWDASMSAQTALAVSGAMPHAPVGNVVLDGVGGHLLWSSSVGFECPADSYSGIYRDAFGLGKDR